MDGKKVLGMDDILDAQDVKYDEVDVPEWGGVVRIGSLSAEDAMEFAETNEGPAQKTAGLRLVLRSLVDAEGNRIGDNDKVLQAFKKRNPAVIARIVKRVMKLNEMDASSDVGKDSGGADGAASPSA